MGFLYKGGSFPIKQLELDDNKSRTSVDWTRLENRRLYYAFFFRLIVLKKHIFYSNSFSKTEKLSIVM